MFWHLISLMITVPHLRKNRQFRKILHKLLKKTHYTMSKEKKKSGFHFSTSEYTVKLKCIHKVHIKMYTSCIYVESGEQRGRKKCKLLHGNQQNVNILWGETVRSCIKLNKNEQLNHSVQPILISSEITEIPDTVVLHPMSYNLHLS